MCRCHWLLPSSDRGGSTRTSAAPPAATKTALPSSGIRRTDLSLVRVLAGAIPRGLCRAPFGQRSDRVHNEIESSPGQCVQIVEARYNRALELVGARCRQRARKTWAANE